MPLISGVTLKVWAAAVAAAYVGSQSVLSTVNLQVTLTYISGAAPLAVFFDATATTSSVQPEAWRDCIYAFDYGDSGSGNYTYGAVTHTKNRNLGGPCGGHVYETPGTYTAKVWCYDGQSFSLKSFTITVTDPDVVYSGTNTICCSTSGDFSGAPSGASTQTVANFQAAMAYVATGKRVLLQRADAWQSTANHNLSGTISGAQIGSFGTGTKATVTKTGAHSWITINSSGISGLTIKDLDLAGGSFSATNGVVVSTGVSIVGLTINNCIIGNSSNLLVCSGTGRVDDLTIHKAVIGPVIGGAGYNGIYAQGQRMLILDSTVNDATSAEHCIRLPYVGKGLIYGLTATNPAANKHAITVRAPTWAGGAISGLAANTYTEYVVVANSSFSSNTPQICTFTPAGSTLDERIRRCVFENNYIYTLGTTAAQGCVLQSFDCVTRNNVFNLSGGSSFPIGIATSTTTAITPSGNISLHDTIYRSDAATTLTGFSAGAGTLLSVIKNMTMHSPSSTNTYVISGTGAYAEQGNPTNAQAKTQDPLFVGPLTSYSGFAIGASSPRKNSGVTIPVWSDGLWYSRDTTPDGGALNSTDNRSSFWASVLGQPS